MQMRFALALPLFAKNILFTNNSILKNLKNLTFFKKMVTKRKIYATIQVAEY